MLAKKADIGTKNIKHFSSNGIISNTKDNITHLSAAVLPPLACRKEHFYFIVAFPG